MAFSSPSSSSSLSTFKYDVLVSFRGDDTRRGFTSHLLKALRDRSIHTISDDDEGKLRGGEEISSSLIDTIQNSRIAIIVFSENYASSRFCLEELSYIIENFYSRIIIPVFYHVEPSHVRHQTGTYGEAFAIHAQTYFKDNILQKWRNALFQVANEEGFIADGNTFESELIERIVERVSTELFNHAPLHNADTVGLESPLKEVCSLLKLNFDPGDVHMLGIYGDTGIGKTTFAREVYNSISHRFEASCFLPNVRENSNIHGLPHLQNMLLSEMIGWKDIRLLNAQKGSTIIQQKLHQKKVLLILDDVDQLEQLEALVGGTDWFGFGSRIIITTQNRHLLVFHGIERIYEVQPLNNRDALELLSQQIFKEGNADPSNTEILNELVTYASGLPLALRVIGSYLLGKSVDEWTNALRQFKRVPPEDIQRKFKSSFDALRHDEKSVFLDIACCFKGYELAKLVAILSANHGNNVKLHIDVLIDKSLVSIGSDDKVRLHPLVEGMGKHIVHQESPNEPGKRSRLWLPEDIVEVLQNNMGTHYTEIIHLDSPSIEDEGAIKWDGKAFKKMKNLRTLIIRKCNFSKAPKYLPNSLRVLEWWRYPSHELPSDFNPKHLDICDLPLQGIMSPRLADLSETEKEKLDRDIQLWSSGKEMDIRLLLSTLHYIMWPKSGWYDVPYTSLKENSQVKEAYQRAISCLHPDELQQRGATLTQEYIAKKVFDILQTCISLSGVFSQSSQVSPTSMDPPSDPEALSNSSQGGAEQGNPPSDPEGSHETSTWFEGFDWKTLMWRVVGTVSGLVGPLCFALSPPSKCSKRGQKLLFILCSVWSLVICAFVLFVKSSSLSRLQSRFICYGVFLIISVYSFLYDKVVDNNPSIVSAVSNLAFALVSLSKSELDKFGFETGTFCYFLGCFTTQLLHIKLKFFFVGIIFSCPLFLHHFPSVEFG